VKENRRQLWRELTSKISISGSLHIEASAIESNGLKSGNHGEENGVVAWLSAGSLSAAENLAATEERKLKAFNNEEK